MTKALFPLPAHKILEAANLIDGRSRFKKLLEDIAEMPHIGLPVFELSDQRKLRMHVTHEELETLVNRRIQEIEDTLDEIGVSYE